MRSKVGATVVSNPRRTAPSTPTVCTSLQTVSQRRHRMHLSMFRVMAAVTSFLRTDCSPLNGISRILNRVTSFWSSQSLHLGQVRQSLGWSERMSSATVFRARTTRAEFVRTTMPSVTRVAQDGARLRRPSTSTTHTRQAAGELLTQVPLRSIWHKAGIVMPTEAAASRTVVPFSTHTARLSIVRLIMASSH